MLPERVNTGFRLTRDALEMIDELKPVLGCGKTFVLETAVRELYKKKRREISERNRRQKLVTSEVRPT